MPDVGIVARVSRWVIVASLACSVALLAAYFADYGNWFIHPHQFEIHLPKLLVPGQDTARGLLNVFQQFDPAENRPRFLSYAVIWANLSLRMSLYDSFVLYPPISVGWIFELLLGPLLLFRLVRNMTASLTGAWAAVLTYVTSVGFLSGFAMPLLPAKPLTNVVFISVLFVMSEAKQFAKPGQLLHEIPGGWRYVAMLATILLAGLFLDEVPVFAFLLPVIFYSDLIVPRKFGLPAIKRAVPTWTYIALPIIVFLLLTVGVIPRVTEALFGYKFDLIGSVLVNEKAAAAGKTFFSGPQYGFGSESLVSNFVSLLGTSFVLWQAVPMTAHPSGSGVITGFQVSLLSGTVPLIALATLVGVAIRTNGRTQAAGYLLRAVACVVLFIIFMSILSGRHVPFIIGYVYGSGLSVFVSLMMGLVVACLAGSRMQIGVAIFVACVAAIQINNFAEINRSWIAFHTDSWIRHAYEKSIRLSENGQQTSRLELSNIWEQWKRGQLEAYLPQTQITPGAVFLVFELRHLDAIRSKRR